MPYSVWVGIWKSVKNVAIVLAPAAAAGWAAFLANAPPEYQQGLAIAASLVVYFAKNYWTNKDAK